ncbi:MAG: hypothetical protein JWM10_794, partial [Myxococcaceae bacterium]|nr:hypothetical protein [Myxococcaceae bacterium]
MADRPAACHGCDGTGQDPHEYGAPCPTCNGHGRHLTPVAPTNPFPAKPPRPREHDLHHGPPRTRKTPAHTQPSAQAAKTHRPDR